MIQTEAFFGAEIRPVILRELALAKYTLHVAVAWFTDPVLFDALLARQRAGGRGGGSGRGRRRA